MNIDISEKGDAMSAAMYCQRCGAICEEFVDGSVKRSFCSKCGFIYYKNPYPCVSVLVADGCGRVLLGKRSEQSIYPDKWCLPCGYIEYEETYLEAAFREVKEETGIEIKPVGVINVVSNRLDNGINSIVLVILAEPETLEITPGDDIIEAKWFDIEEDIPDLAFKADCFIISKYKSFKDKILEMECIELTDTCF